MRRSILRSSDGKSYELEGKAALQSGHDRRRLPGRRHPRPLPPGDILDMVVVYCLEKSAPWTLGFVDQLDRLTLSRVNLA
ncbi:hypothetical protein MLD38_001450 [Melastoma candidum]|uniref:Uncharacterized protein n=1 Tax=Melastoma candidum TaxID=119954 RepID=A0ACB9SEW4_9MYRT|nr:hypothetical protein MLD38_001450 [Melastoma candidum]